MDFDTLVEGPLLKISFLVLCIGMVFRITLFIASILRGSRDTEAKGLYIFTNFLRFIAPFYRAVPKKPLYASLRYAFHVCLVVVPVWFAGHISIWEESRFEWSWSAIPDQWADWMTLVLLALALFFIIRHVAAKEVRLNTSISDYVLIIIAAMPFMTGYFLTHGTLDSVPFIGSNLWAIHILTGEIMMIAVVFLFCRTRMDERKCTGCASCVLSCPTGTLESEDSGNMRFFHYSLSQCVCCASCVNTCPEDAAALRHEFGLKNLFQGLTKQEIRSVELESCNRCGALFVPEPLMEKIQKTFSYEYLQFCPDCRKINMGDYLQELSRWHRKPKKAA
jgi:Pyruvate/2-oxoacid:ferredoxin oxidoreductase delta subunit